MVAGPGCWLLAGHRTVSASAGPARRRRGLGRCGQGRNALLLLHYAVLSCLHLQTTLFLFWALETAHTLTCTCRLQRPDRQGPNEHGESRKAGARARKVVSSSVRVVWIASDDEHEHRGWPPSLHSKETQSSTRFLECISPARALLPITTDRRSQHRPPASHERNRCSPPADTALDARRSAGST